MKIKRSIASLALAVSFGSANATIETGANGSGELFLSVWDKAAQRSYSQDLGVDLSRFLFDPAYQHYSGITWAIQLNPVIWSAFFDGAHAADIVYHVAGARTDNRALNALDPSYGYLSSFNPDNPLPPAQAALSVQLTAVQLPALNIVSKAIAYNGATPSNPSQNDARTWLPNQDGYYPTAFGDQYDNTVPPYFPPGLPVQSSEGEFGSITRAIFHGLYPELIYDPDAEGDVMGDRFVILPGKFQLTAAELKYAVPVPAAVWLLGSALAGFPGFSRRARQAFPLLSNMQGITSRP